MFEYKATWLAGGQPGLHKILTFMTTMNLGSFNKNMWRNYFTPELFWISGYRSKGMAALLSLSTDFSRGRPKETATVMKYAQCCETLKGKIDQSDGAVLKDTVLVYIKSGRTLGGQKLGQDTVGLTAQ